LRSRAEGAFGLFGEGITSSNFGFYAVYVMEIIYGLRVYRETLPVERIDSETSTAGDGANVDAPLSGDGAETPAQVGRSIAPPLQAKAYTQLPLGRSQGRSPLDTNFPDNSLSATDVRPTPPGQVGAPAI
jgi:hypothetical protein